MIVNELPLILRTKVINNAIPPFRYYFPIQTSSKKLVTLLIIIFDFPDYEIYCNIIYVYALIRLSTTDRTLRGL